MSEQFTKIKQYVTELDYDIQYQDKEDEILIINHLSEGINQMVLSCNDTLLVMEQAIIDLSDDLDIEVYKTLLKKNRDIIHGAFVLDETGKRLIFRDTLQIQNLDLNELESSIYSLSILLSEFTNELISISK